MSRRQVLRSAYVLVNGLTLSRLPVGILSVPVFYSESLSRYLPLFFGYLFLSDMLDGALAQRLRAQTKAGSILDYVVDRLNYYLQICVLINQGVSILLFIPYFIRDLLSVFVLTYLPNDRVPGRKELSFLGTAAVYLYVLAISYRGSPDPVLSAVLFAALMTSLADFAGRISKLRRRLVEQVKKDLSG